MRCARVDARNINRLMQNCGASCKNAERYLKMPRDIGEPPLFHNPKRQRGILLRSSQSLLPTVSSAIPRLRFGFMTAPLRRHALASKSGAENPHAHACGSPVCFDAALFHNPKRQRGILLRSSQSLLPTVSSAIPRLRFGL